MYRHIKEYEIKFTDCDPYDILKPSSLLSFLEESACLSADELGFGYGAVAPKNLGFIIVNSYIELARPVKLGEVLELHTWPLRPKNIIFFRDFELYVKGEKVGVATTRWCMIDTQTFKMMPTSAFFTDLDFSSYNTERSVEFSTWKIPALAEGELAYSKKVSYSDYDHYFHVNNTKYADFLLDTFSVDEIENKFIKKLQITYAKQCKIDEVIDLYRKIEGNTYFIEGRVGGEVRVQFKVELDGI